MSNLLVYDSKIAFYCESFTGYLAAAEITSADLQVESLEETVLPLSFERAVFSVCHNDSFQKNDAESNEMLPLQDTSQGPRRVVKYGDVVRLKHSYTGKWVCVKKRIQSSSEKSCLKISLLNSDDIEDPISTAFRILPQFKVREKGETVRLQDLAIFLCEGLDSRYLHISSQSKGDWRFECNCSTTSTPFTVRFYDHPEDESGRIRAGEPIALFHKEWEGFLSSDPLIFKRQGEVYCPQNLYTTGYAGVATSNTVRKAGQLGTMAPEAPISTDSFQMTGVPLLDLQEPTRMGASVRSERNLLEKSFVSNVSSEGSEDSGAASEYYDSDDWSPYGSMSPRTSQRLKNGPRASIEVIGSEGKHVPIPTLSLGQSTTTTGSGEVSSEAITQGPLSSHTPALRVTPCVSPSASTSSSRSGSPRNDPERASHFTASFDSCNTSISVTREQVKDHGPVPQLALQEPTLEAVPQFMIRAPTVTAESGEVDETVQDDPQDHGASGTLSEPILRTTTVSFSDMPEEYSPIIPPATASMKDSLEDFSISVDPGSFIGSTNTDSSTTQSLNVSTSLGPQNVGERGAKGGGFYRDRSISERSERSVCTDITDASSVDFFDAWIEKECPSETIGEEGDASKAKKGPTVDTVSQSLELPAASPKPTRSQRTSSAKQSPGGIGGAVNTYQHPRRPRSATGPSAATVEPVHDSFASTNPKAQKPGGKLALPERTESLRNSFNSSFGQSEGSGEFPGDLSLKSSIKSVLKQASCDESFSSSLAASRGKSISFAEPDWALNSPSASVKLESTTVDETKIPTKDHSPPSTAPTPKRSPRALPPRYGESPAATVEDTTTSSGEYEATIIRDSSTCDTPPCTVEGQNKAQEAESGQSILKAEPVAPRARGLTYPTEKPSQADLGIPELITSRASLDLGDSTGQSGLLQSGAHLDAGSHLTQSSLLSAGTSQDTLKAGSLSPRGGVHAGGTGKSTIGRFPTPTSDLTSSYNMGGHNNMSFSGASAFSGSSFVSNKSFQSSRNLSAGDRPQNHASPRSYASGHASPRMAIPSGSGANRDRHLASIASGNVPVMGVAKVGSGSFRREPTSGGRLDDPESEGNLSFSGTSALSTSGNWSNARTATEYILSEISDNMISPTSNERKNRSNLHSHRSHTSGLGSGPVSRTSSNMNLSYRTGDHLSTGRCGSGNGGLTESSRSSNMDESVRRMVSTMALQQSESFFLQPLLGSTSQGLNASRERSLSLNSVGMDEMEPNMLYNFMAQFVQDSGGDDGPIFLCKQEGGKSKATGFTGTDMGNSLWMVECEDADQGGPVRCGVCYRLKHISTRRYLIIIETEVGGEFNESEKGTGYFFTLSRDPSGTDSLFIFHPLDEDSSNHNPSISTLRIQHYNTGMFLHVPPNKATHGVDPVIPQRIEMALSNRPLYKDVFILSRSRPRVVIDLNNVLQNKTTLTSYTGAWYSGHYEFGEEDMNRWTSDAHHAVTNLIIFCTTGTTDLNPLTRTGVPDKRAQMLLLDQNVHECLIDLLKAPFYDEQHNQNGKLELSKLRSTNLYKPLQILCTLAYRLLRMIVRGSTEYALKLSEHIPFMQKQLPHQLNVADTLMEIFRNNKVLLAEMSEDVLTYFVTLCRQHAKQAQYLNFLCELCVCNGEPIPRIQEILCKKVDQHSNQILLPMRVGHKGRQVEVMIPSRFEFSTPNQSSTNKYNSTNPERLAAIKAIRRINEKKEEPMNRRRMKSMVLKMVTADESTKRTLIDGVERDKWITLPKFTHKASHFLTSYLEKCFTLYGRLCMNNDKTQPVIARFLPKDAVEILLNKEDKRYPLPADLKSKLYNIATHTYIDTANNVWGELGVSRSTVKSWTCLKDENLRSARGANTGKNDTFVGSLKRVSLEFLADHTVLYPMQTSMNILVFSVLDLWRHLVIHALQTPEEQTLLINYCINLLDSDVPATSAVTNSSFAGKLGGGASKTVTGRLSAGSGGGQDYSRIYEYNEQNALIMDCKRVVCYILSRILDYRCDVVVHAVMAEFRKEVIAGSTTEIITGKMIRTMDHAVNAGFLGDSIVTFLLEMTQNQWEPLVFDALQLLFRICNPRNEVYNLLKNLHILFDKDSEDICQNIAKKVIQLKGLINQKMDAKDEKECVKILTEITSHIHQEDRQTSYRASLPSMHALNSQRSGRSARARSGYFTFRTAEDLMLSYKGRITEHQDMLRNIGVHMLILEALALPFENKNKERGRRRLFKAGYKYLRLFVMDHPRNQKLLYDQLHEYGYMKCVLKHIFYDIGAEQCLYDMFALNYELCSQVSEEIVNSCMTLVTNRSGINSLKHIDFLKQLVMVGGMPITRNQSMVMNALVEQQSGHLQAVLPTLDIQRNYVLQEEIASLVDLAALCCVGLNSSTEELAQSLIPQHIVLRLVGEDSTAVGTDGPMKLEFQLPFITFLREVWWVYEATDGVSPDLTDWVWKDEWWAVVERYRNIMLTFNEDTWDESMGSEQQHINFIFDGIILSLIDFLEHSWTKDMGTTLPLQNTNFLDEIVTECTKLIENDEHSDLINSTQYMYMERFLREALQAGIHGECDASVIDGYREKLIQRADDLEKQQQQDSHIEKHTRAMKIDAFVRDTTVRFQEVLHEMSTTSSLTLGEMVDDPIAFTDLVQNFLKTSTRGGLIQKKLISIMQSSDLPQHITIGLLRNWIAALDSYIDREDQKGLEALQIAIDKDGGTKAMVTLIPRADDAISKEAVAFGIALLHGGNSTVQDSLLCKFQDPQCEEGFFASILCKLQSSVSALKQRKREVAYLQENVATQEQMQYWKSRVGNTGLDSAKDVLRLIQLFCEGHHLALQNYIRDQKGQMHSFNLVTEVTILLKELLSCDLDEPLASLAIQTFNTLTEVCQGPCPANQSSLVAANVCGQVNIVLRDNQYTCRQKTVFELRCSAVLTVLSLLEGCADVTRAHLVLQSLSFQALQDLMTSVSDYLSDCPEHSNKDNGNRGQGPSQEHEQYLDLAFNVFILIYILLHATESPLQEQFESWSAYPYFRSMLGIIEIAREDKVEKVYFRIPTVSMQLAEDSKANLLATVDRSSPSSKLADFFEKAMGLIFELEYRIAMYQKLEECLPVPSKSIPCHNALNQIRNFVIYKCHTHITEVENMMLFTAFTVNCMYISAPLGSESYLIKLSLSLMGLMILVLSVVMIVSVTCLKIPGLVADQEKPELGSKQEISFSQLASIIFSNRSVGVRRTLVYYLTLFLSTLMGIFFNPGFYSLHLLVVVNKSILLQNVIRSVTLNGKSLLLTALLGVIIVYIFSVTGYALFPQDFTNDDGTAHCDSLYQCFVFSLTAGIRAGGGLGELLITRGWNEDSHTKRLVFDSLFHIVVIVIFLNIIFGIIIDTFAELRDQKCKVEEDTRSRCFICGIDSYSFDRFVEGGFARHVKISHNMWQYMYFMHHLWRKQKDEHTGQESYVYEKMVRKDTTFFPLESLDLMGALETHNNTRDSDMQDPGVSLRAGLKVRPEVFGDYDSHSVNGLTHRDDDDLMSVKERVRKVEEDVKMSIQKLEGLEDGMDKIQDMILMVFKTIQDGQGANRIETGTGSRKGSNDNGPAHLEETAQAANKPASGLLGVDLYADANEATNQYPRRSASPEATPQYPQRASSPDTYIAASTVAFSEADPDDTTPSYLPNNPTMGGEYGRSRSPGVRDVVGSGNRLSPNPFGSRPYRWRSPGQASFDSEPNSSSPSPIPSPTNSSLQKYRMAPARSNSLGVSPVKSRGSISPNGEREPRIRAGRETESMSGTTHFLDEVSYQLTPALTLKSAQSLKQLRRDGMYPAQRPTSGPPSTASGPSSVRDSSRMENSPKRGVSQFSHSFNSDLQRQVHQRSASQELERSSSHPLASRIRSSETSVHQRLRPPPVQPTEAFDVTITGPSILRQTPRGTLSSINEPEESSDLTSPTGEEQKAPSSQEGLGKRLLRQDTVDIKASRISSGQIAEIVSTLDSDTLESPVVRQVNSSGDTVNLNDLTLSKASGGKLLPQPSGATIELTDLHETMKASFNETMKDETQPQSSPPTYRKPSLERPPIVPDSSRKSSASSAGSAGMPSITSQCVMIPASSSVVVIPPIPIPDCNVQDTKPKVEILDNSARDRINPSPKPPGSPRPGGSPAKGAITPRTAAKKAKRQKKATSKATDQKEKGTKKS